MARAYDIAGRQPVCVDVYPCALIRTARTAAQTSNPRVTSPKLTGSGTPGALWAFATPGLTSMLYRFAFGNAGSMKINGSADALADSENRLSPVPACTNNVNVLASPDLARVLSVPKNEEAVVPQVPSLQTAINESPAAVVWVNNSANPIPWVGSLPFVNKLVAIRTGTMSPVLPPVTWKEYVMVAVAADPWTRASFGGDAACTDRLTKGESVRVA